MTIGNPNPKLQWANMSKNQKECGAVQGDPSRHKCSLIEGHIPEKLHACYCGAEFYVRHWKPRKEVELLIEKQRLGDVK